jgi:hypothetical protein
MLREILKKNRSKLITIYFYLATYELLNLLTPIILGKAIDGLIDKNFLWISIFFSIEFTANLFMYKRMVYDTVVYTKIYNDIVFDYLEKEKSTVSEQCARTDLAGNIIHFFEDAIPYYIMSVIGIFGSLFFIFWSDFLTGIIVLTCLAPIMILVQYFYPKINKVTQLANNHYESKIESLEKKSYGKYFHRRRKLQIYRSTLQGKSWWSLNNVKTSFLVLSLTIFTYNRSNITQGEAIAIYAYINQFLISLMSIPVAMEIYSMISDVVKRINEE